MAQIACKYSDWLTNYTFDNCKLNRKEYGEFLANYITGEHNGFVLNINGAWGTGKTEFLRRLYTHLTLNKHPTIYIDAWESDFSKNPLSVVSSELINQLDEINENIGSETDKLLEYLGKAVKGATIAGAGLASKYLVDDSATGRELVKPLFESSPKDFLEQVRTEHEEQVSAIKHIRKELTSLAEVLKENLDKNLPVVVLIDELDRCRPNYAIEMLEVIKHFFTTEQFVFVVATDTAQLKQSIKSVYGAEFDSSNYLKRFFHREAQLEEPDLEHYLAQVPLDLESITNEIRLYPLISSENVEATTKKYVEWCAKAYSLSIRDIDQLVNKLNACLRTIYQSYVTSNEIQVVNIFCLLAAIIEFVEQREIFDERTNDNPLIENPKLKIVRIATTEIFDNETGIREDKETVFSELYKICMESSVLHTQTTKSDYHDKYRLPLPINPKSLRDSATQAQHDLVFIIKSIITQLKYHHNPQCKVWFWTDYQKVVKLAGTIT